MAIIRDEKIELYNLRDARDEQAAYPENPTRQV